ncbi:sigma factor [Streptosporangium sp. NPDC000239]|uniref:RNA polymerase sigma factor n=1 Tax=Streptosporangium sp. NPDC000239 TaxID=3154248 RepID=UPI003318B459
MERTMRTRLRAGDPAAFSELFGEHAQTIYRYAARTTGDRTAAEDVVSLTFLEAWRLRGRLKPDADGERTEWIFDADSLAFLGTRDYLIADSSRGRAGTLMSSSAVMSQTVTDQAG